MTYHTDVLSTRSSLRFGCGLIAFVLCLGQSIKAGAPAVIDLWPGTPPGETATLPPESDLTKPTENLIAGKKVIRLGNISRPTMTIYSPAPAQNTGTAVIVSPGGGYRILAYDLEGTEVCQWLNSLGITAVLLKYRVPGRGGVPNYVPALQDAQRALGMVRKDAQKLGVNPDRIGALGFSAGGHLSALLSTGDGKRTYPTVDDADEISCRPNFCLLIYPGGLTVKGDNDTISPELKVSKNTPPTFLVMAEDDPVRVQNVLYYYIALEKAKVPAELHVYPTGGHGYGLRPTSDFVTTWPARAADWLSALSWLKR